MQLSYEISLCNPFRWNNLSAAIRALFASSEQGAWYDPSDLTTLFQDSAGTIPVTATGQPVGRMNDKSGRGNHATQATAAARPVLQIDAGKYYLAFDGVDDAMATASIDFTATDKITIVAGVRVVNGAIGMIYELSANAATNAGAFYSVANELTDRDNFKTGGTLSPSPVYTPAISSPRTSVLTGIGDIAAPSIIVRRNGAQVASDASSQGTGNFGNHPLYIGARAGSSLFFSGRLYSMIIRGAASSAAQITSAETYANSKTGAY